MLETNLSKGQQIEILLDTGVRLKKRYLKAVAAYQRNPNDATFHRMELIDNANRRLARKMRQVLCS